MRRLRLPLGSVEKVTARVRMDEDDSDPTAFTIEWALTATDAETPASGDWEDGAWLAGGPPYRMEALITVADGAFAFWLRISGSGETVLRRVGIIESR